MLLVQSPHNFVGLGLSDPHNGCLSFKRTCVNKQQTRLRKHDLVLIVADEPAKSNDLEQWDTEEIAEVSVSLRAFSKGDNNMHPSSPSYYTVKKRSGQSIKDILFSISVSSWKGYDSSSNMTQMVFY